MAKRTPVAIVGAASLIGRELVELIHEQKLSVATHLFSGEPESAGGNIAVEDGEPVFYEALSKESLSGVQWILLAGAPESSERALKFAPPATRLIDITGALDTKRDAVFRSPYAETAPPAEAATARLAVSAHPAASALALVLSRLGDTAGIKSSVVTVFEPASERGQAGVGELQKQTAALLTFQKMPSAVFDTQAAYNLLSAYGEDAPLPLQSVEDRIARHLESLRGSEAPQVSLRLIQAPVFHGYTFNLWVEFQAKCPALDKLRAVLQQHPLIDFRPEDTTQPSNTGAAQQSGLLVGEPKSDRANPSACWIWAACDNVRVAADNALRILAEGLSAST